jgi:uncharacterized RDD family membrane protein YckC
MQPVPETPFGGWNGSELFRPVDPDDFSGSRRGYFGDIRVANPLLRIGSLFIDMMLCVFLPGLIAEVLGLSDSTMLWLTFIFVAANSIVYAQSRGQTVGKMLLGLQAVRGVKLPRGKGYAIVNRGPVMNFLRAGLHALDFLLFYVSIPLIVFSPRHRSIGDYLTRTVVIRPQNIERLRAAPSGSVTVTS